MSVNLKIENVTKLYDKQVALENIILEIKAGEFVCLLGPSGCGKSTLLRLIAGLDTPNKGQIKINDQEVTHLPPAKRNYGIMFQSYALFPNLTAFENVVYALRNKKLKEQVINERADRLFEMIRLSDAKNKYPSQLSGGEQQRVALARALATEPDFLLLDEPLSALDAKVRVSLRQQICAIQKELNLTTIMVTHDQDEALTMADRIIVMNKATIMQEGTPEEVYLRPVNPFVADFIGSINFMDQDMYHARNMKLLEKDTIDILAVRPEKITLHKEQIEESFRATIKELEFRGIFYRATIEVVYLLKSAELYVDIPFQQIKELQLQVGSEVYAKIQEDATLHFKRNMKTAI